MAACTIQNHEDDDEPSSVKDWPTRDGRVVDNMRDVQYAAEHYAADHGHNSYPMVLDPIWKSYFPGGVEGQTPSPVGPANPFSGRNEWPTIGHTIADVKEARRGQYKISLKPGEIQYTPLHDGTSYAVVAADHKGNLIMDPMHQGDVLVLSNE